MITIGIPNNNNTENNNNSNNIPTNLYIKYDINNRNEVNTINRLTKYLNKIPPYQLLPMYPGIPKPEIFISKVPGRNDILVTYFGLYNVIIDYLEQQEKLINGIGYQWLDNKFDAEYFLDHTEIFDVLFDEKIKNNTDNEILEQGIYETFKNQFVFKKLFPGYLKQGKNYKGIIPREYQIEAAFNILSKKMSLSQLATRSGKTLITYIVLRYLLEYLKRNKKEESENNLGNKVLMIVPSIHLVKQGIDDFLEYSLESLENLKNDKDNGSEDIYEYTYYKNGKLKSKTLKESIKNNLPGFGGIYGGSKDFQGYENIVIGTYQSLIKKLDRRSKQYDPEFFKQFNILVIDEAHKLPCKSIGNLLEVCKNNIQVKFGLTGSLPKENTIESQICYSLSGPCIQNIDAIELINEDILAKPIIEQIILKYNYNYKFIRGLIRTGECIFQDEKTGEMPNFLKILRNKYLQMDNSSDMEDYAYSLMELASGTQKAHILENQLLQDLSEESGRFKVLTDILDNHIKQGQNGIIFAHNTEYINRIANYLENYYKNLYKNTGKKDEYDKIVIKKITGSVNLKKRQEILDIMEQNSKVILIGSYGAVGTGLTFKNVQYGIFAQSFKSEIIVKQSLGRLMLKGNTGNPDIDNYFRLYDLIDDFIKPLGRLRRHGSEKLKIYKKEGYSVTTKNIGLFV